MFEGSRIAVVVPSFNEAEHIGRTIRSVPSFVDHIVVVDDGSGDETIRAAMSESDSRMRIVAHDRNMGVGAAIVTGYRAATGEGADIVAVMAGDGQMDPVDLPALLAPIAHDDVDYVKGDRLSHPACRARMPLSRWLGNHALTTLTRWATGVEVHDSQCGYTAIRRGFAEALAATTTWPRYGYPNDFIGCLLRMGAKIRDVVVHPVYSTETSGVGWRHALFVVPFVIVRIALRRLRWPATEWAPRLDP